MALRARSLFLYGYEVTPQNQSIDFRVVAAEPIRQATLRLGFYSLTELLTEIVRAQKEVAGTFDFFATANRTLSGGTQNRITLSTSSAYYDILINSGPRATTSFRTLVGFPNVDQTGAVTYTGTTSSGTGLVTDFIGGGHNYLPPQNFQEVFGNVNVSAAGTKEAIVFQIQEFWQVQFKYEPESRMLTEWQPLLRWMIQQKPLEFTPEISSPNTFFEGTLERTPASSKGLGFKMNEMLPSFPFLYDTGLMTFRKKVI